MGPIIHPNKAKIRTPYPFFSPILSPIFTHSSRNPLPLSLRRCSALPQPLSFLELPSSLEQRKRGQAGARTAPTRAREKEKVGKGRGELGTETLEDPQSTGLKSKYISCMGRRSVTTIRTSLMSHFVARVWL